jgi:hypothetical protein
LKDFSQLKRGIEEGLKEYYSKLPDLNHSQAEEIASAVLRLAKLRVFQEV